MNITKIKIDRQDRSTVAWKKLCEYVDIVAESKGEEFYPRQFLGEELFTQIYALPETIATLKSVKKMRLYGSRLTRIPPEIGQMASLEYFDPYASDSLCWLPAEKPEIPHHGSGIRILGIVQKERFFSHSPGGRAGGKCVMVNDGAVFLCFHRKNR